MILSVNSAYDMHTTINLSILDFKSQWFNGIDVYHWSINLSILDFKFEKEKRKMSDNSL